MGAGPTRLSHSEHVTAELPWETSKVGAAASAAAAPGPRPPLPSLGAASLHPGPPSCFIPPPCPQHLAHR